MPFGERLPRHLVRTTPRLALAALLVWAWLALPRSTLACSCVGFEGFDRYADAEHVVVAGIAAARESDRLTIAVETWFWGGAPQPLLVVREPDENDMCSMGPNADLATRWLWVAWRGPGGPPTVNSCQPSWSLDTPEGLDALLAARTTFGVATTLEPTSAPPGAEEPPGAPDPVAIAAAAVSLAAGVAVLGSAAVLSRRRR